MKAANQRQSTMRAVRPPARSQQPRTYSREQRAVQNEFCETYNLKPEQVGFDGASLEPIFDYDALVLLSIRLCDIPNIVTEFNGLDRLNGLATCRCTLTLPGGLTRSMFASAMLGETMPDGEPIRDIFRRRVRQR